MTSTRRQMLRRSASALGACVLGCGRRPAATEPARRDDRAAWLAEVSRGRSARDRRLLDRASQRLEANVCAPSDGGVPPWAPLRGVCPSPSGYPGVWNWDSAFHAMTLARWDPALARDQVRIILDRQQPSGLLPDVVWLDGRVVTAFGKPPVFPWACARVDRLAPDASFLRYAYDRFVRYEAFWVRERGGAAEGLFHYDSAVREPPSERAQGARFESGWDNSVRWDGGVETLWPVDLNCYMVLAYRALDTMAARLSAPAAEREAWRRKGDALAARIEATLWDPTLGAYCDVTRSERRSTGVLTPASFMPLFAGTASRERAAGMARLAASRDGFYPAMPTVAYDHPAYRSDQYWRGPTWLNTAWFAARGLRAFGFGPLADAIRETVLGWCDANRDAIYEYYDSRSGRGLGARDFGWSAAFIIELVLDS